MYFFLLKIKFSLFNKTYSSWVMLNITQLESDQENKWTVKKLSYFDDKKTVMDR